MAVAVPLDVVKLRLYEMEEAAVASVAAGPLTPLQWAEQNAVIVTPGVGIEHWQPYDYQAALLNDTSPRRLVLKARQTGLSTAIALEALYYALHRDHDRTLFVSRNQELAGLLIQYVQVAIAGLKHPPKLVGESQSKLVFANGSEIVSLPANPSTGRGYPASRVYLDEAAFLEYGDLIMQGILPTLSTGGQMTVQSTAKGRNNLFFRLWSGIEGGAWSRHRIHWSDCPRYDEAWAERTRAGMTSQAFGEEFDLDFLTSGDAVFDPDDLARCKIGWNPSPVGCSRLVHIWDIGRRRDHTVGITLGERGDTWHVIDEGPAAFARFLAPYPVIQSRIEVRHRAVKGTTIVESNGVGDTVIENLTVRVTPFVTTRKTKVQAIQALQLLIQQGRFKHGIDQLDRELSLYEWDDDDLIQDCVMTAAMGADHVAPIHQLGRAFDKASAKTPPPPTPQQQIRRASINSPEFVEEQPEGRSRLAAGWR